MAERTSFVGSGRDTMECLHALDIRMNERLTDQSAEEQRRIQKNNDRVFRTGIDRLVAFLIKHAGMRKTTGGIALPVGVGQNDLRTTLRTEGMEFLSNYQNIAALIRDLPTNDAIALLEKINGLARIISPSRGGARNPEYGAAKQTRLGYSPRTKRGTMAFDLWYPEYPDSVKYLEHTLTGLRNDFSQQISEESTESGARSLLRTILFAQPFLNANKRTARLIYVLLSPDIPKSPQTIEPCMRNVLENESRSFDHYHGLVLTAGVDTLYARRGIAIHTSEDGQRRADHLVDSKFEGFDRYYLGYLSAYDILGPEKIKQSARQLKSTGEYELHIRDLPPDAINDIEVHLWDVRKEFFDFCINGDFGDYDRLATLLLQSAFHQAGDKPDDSMSQSSSV